MRWFVKSHGNSLCSKYLNTDGTSVHNSSVTFSIYQISWEAKNRTWLYKKMQAARFSETFTTAKMLFSISQSIWTSIKNLFPHFQSASSPDPRTDFVCFSVVTDGQADGRTDRQADINPVDRDFGENTWDFSWNISSFMFLVSISFVTQDCTTANSHFMHLPFLPLGSYFLLPVFLVHRGVISLNSSVAILQLSLIPFRVGSFPCLRH